jgi:hypothetical protein
MTAKAAEVMRSEVLVWTVWMVGSGMTEWTVGERDPPQVT